jgi:hypothetical protein
LATSAQLDFPFGTVIDSLGNLFISELGASGSGVREVNTSGTITTVAGVVGKVGYSGDGGLATSALFAFPHGLALDTSGDLLISDSSNNRIRQVISLAAPTNLSLTCGVPQYATTGQLVSSFPASLILNSPIQVTESYYIPYSGEIQSTAEFNIEKSAKAAFEEYEAYFATNGWTVTGTLIRPTFYVIASTLQGIGNVQAQTIVGPTSSGSNITVGIFIPNLAFDCGG